MRRRYLVEYLGRCECGETYYSLLVDDESRAVVVCRRCGALVEEVGPRRTTEAEVDDAVAD